MSMLRTSFARSGVRKRSQEKKPVYVEPTLFLATDIICTPLLDYPDPSKLEELSRRALLDRCCHGRLGCLRIPQPTDFRCEDGETQGH